MVPVIFFFVGFEYRLIMNCNDILNMD